MTRTMTAAALMSSGARGLGTLRALIDDPDTTTVEVSGWWVNSDDGQPVEYDVTSATEAAAAYVATGNWSEATMQPLVIQCEVWREVSWDDADFGRQSVRIDEQTHDITVED